MTDKVADEAVRAGSWIIAEHRPRSWLVYSDEVRASLARSWEPTARAVLEAALPHLACSCPHISEVDDYCPQHGRDA